MLLSIALIISVGLLLGAAAKKLHLPALTGYLAAGLLLGPHALNALDASMLAISADVRKLALVIILMKAGLALDLRELRRAGRPAALLCFLPATAEMAGFVLLAPQLLGITPLEAGILGAVMGAVSPAVVVPRMTRMMEEGWGTAKGIPQMIVAGASADDVYVIAVFSSLVALAAGGSVSAADFLQVPLAILLGIAGGVLAGLALAALLRMTGVRGILCFGTVLAAALFLTALEGRGCWQTLSAFPACWR